MNDFERRLPPAETMARLQQQLADDVRAAAMPRYRAPEPLPPVRIGLTAAEVKRFDMARAFALAERGELMRAGGHEAEVAKDFAGRMHHRTPMPHTVYVPWEILAPSLTRDLAVGTGTAGGFFVGTSTLTPSDVLFPGSAVEALGAVVLPGCRDSLVVPRLATNATVTWLANEQTAATESSPTTAVATTLVAKTAAAYVEYSGQGDRQFNASAMLEAHLRRVAAAVIDAAALQGTGGAQPQGIVGTAGVGSVAGASLGAAGALEFMSDTAAVGTPSRFGYAAGVASAVLLAQRPAVASATALWQGPAIGRGATMLGAPAFGTASLTGTTVIGGDWAQLVVALFGPGATVQVNPYANFQANIRAARLWIPIDVAVAQPASFSVAVSVT
jgi:hypothetical protein